MKINRITDRRKLAAYFRQDLNIHFYSLGDLDDFYWPNTICLGIESSRGVEAVSTIYRGDRLPVLLVFSDPGKLSHEYINQLIYYLPDQVYAHLSPDLERYFQNEFNVTEIGDHFKMKLENPDILTKIETKSLQQLSKHDLPEMIDLYKSSYPGNAFDPRMVLTGLYFGYRLEGRIVSAGGVHVYSEKYKVAALGNITTHPDHRNQGLAKMVTAKICQALAGKVEFIGLNVKCSNLAAIKLYQALGFKISNKYGEFSLKKAQKT
jgi:ribosomal protein S18 acetylase RimI-like enzyme